MDKRCKECDLEMENIEHEPDVGIVGGWHCSHCDIYYEDVDDYEENYPYPILRDGAKNK